MPTLLFQWHFTPPDLFEERVELRSGPYLFAIDSGRAQTSASVDDAPDDYRLIRTELHGRLDTLILAAQVFSHEPCSLYAPSVFLLHEDGRRDSLDFSITGHLTAQLDDIGTIGMEESGTSITQTQRLARRNSFAELAAAFMRDPIVSSILRSYSAAVADPRNEFVHLYEIKEAIGRRLRATGATKEKIIGGPRGRRLRQLANKMPVLQGRHRGEHLQSLRDATPAELAEARDIGRQMIEDYLKYLKGAVGRRK